MAVERAMIRADDVDAIRAQLKAGTSNDPSYGCSDPHCKTCEKDRARRHWRMIADNLLNVITEEIQARPEPHVLIVVADVHTGNALFQSMRTRVPALLAKNMRMMMPDGIAGFLCGGALDLVVYFDCAPDGEVLHNVITPALCDRKGRCLAVDRLGFRMRTLRPVSTREIVAHGYPPIAEIAAPVVAMREPVPAKVLWKAWAPTLERSHISDG